MCRRTRPSDTGPFSTVAEERERQLSANQLLEDWKPPGLGSACDEEQRLNFRPKTIECLDDRLLHPIEMRGVEGDQHANWRPVGRHRPNSATTRSKTPARRRAIELALRSSEIVDEPSGDAGSGSARRHPRANRISGTRD